MQASRAITSTFFTTALAVPLLAGCLKLGDKTDETLLRKRELSRS